MKLTCFAFNIFVSTYAHKYLYILLIFYVFGHYGHILLYILSFLLLVDLHVVSTIINYKLYWNGHPFTGFLLSSTCLNYSSNRSQHPLSLTNTYTHTTTLSSSVYHSMLHVASLFLSSSDWQKGFCCTLIFFKFHPNFKE